jgi:regulator of protease activity HflC (stomatin/prohibitin superfamily)
MNAGMNFRIPFVERVAYNQNLKEQIMTIHQQNAITKDNVNIMIDGVLYYKIRDVYKASYEVANPVKAITELAQTSMRSEIGKMMLDKTFEER